MGLDATRIGGFLTHLERVRGNSARTRNARLAAVHSLFSYAAQRTLMSDGVSEQEYEQTVAVLERMARNLGYEG